MRNQTNAGNAAPAQILSVRNIISFLSISFILFITSFSAKAQCPLSCNGNANISLGINGTSTITIYNVMNNPPPNCLSNYELTLMDSKGKPISNPITCTYLGQTIMYSVKDISNGNSCWGNLFIEDKLPPQLLCSDITLECNDPTEVDSVGKPLVIDNCDQAPKILSQGEVITQIDCDNSQGILYTITRTWIAKDKSGNFSLPCTQKISIRKPLLSNVQYPPNYNIANGKFLDCTVTNTSPDTLGEPMYNGGPLTLMCKIIYTFSDSIDMRCSGNRTIMRTWTVVDCCTNTITSHLQTIMLLDTSPPTVTCPADFVVPTKPGLCTADVVLPVPVAVDNCSDSISISISQSGFGSLGFGPYPDVVPGFYEIKYTVCDDCLNCTSCQVAFEVKELELPVVICNTDFILSLDATGIATIGVDQIDNGTFDNCCLDSLAVKIMGQDDSLYSPEVEFNCNDVNQDFFVILRALDCHGNSNFCMSNIHIIDTIAPSISCSDDITIYCTQPLLADSSTFPVVSDICGIASIFYTDSLFLNPCNTGEVERIWTAIDSAGNMSSCLQLISVIDTTAPVIGFPPDITINCLLTPDSTLTGTPATFDDCSLFHISHTDQFINVPQGCNRIDRTWNILNLCDNSITSEIQSIVLFDNIPPVWQTKPGVLDLTVECDKDVFEPVPIAADNCNTVNVVKTGDVTNIICKNRYTRILSYRAFDGCENASVPFIVTIKVDDQKDPVLLNCPLDTVVAVPADSCSKYLSFLTATATDNCGDVTISNNSPYAINNNSGNISGTYPTGSYTITIIAQDGCGNGDTCTVNIDVVDLTPPVADCEDVTITLVGTISPTDTLFTITSDLILDIVNASDNCSGLIVNANPSVFDCGDVGPPPKAFTITFEDISGNITVCNAQVLVVDSFGVCGTMFNNGNLVMGHMTTPYESPIKNASVEIDLNNQLNKTTTDEFGYYMFAHVPNGTDVSIRPVKNDDYLNGVDVLDIIYLTKYILGVAKLPHPYSKLAGDVNETHTLSVGDLGEIRRLILQSQNSFSSGKSWKFIDAKCQKDALANELSPNLPESVVIPDISYHSIFNDFIAVKLGDIDFSSKSYNASGELEVRTEDKAVLEIPERIIKKDKTYTIELALKEAELWSGIQAGIEFTKDIFIEKIEPGTLPNMSLDNLYRSTAEPGSINFIWDSPEENKSFDRNSIMTISFKSNTTGKLSELLKLKSTYKNIAYDKQLIPGDISLQFVGDKNESNYLSTKIFPNRPNPFKSETIWPVYASDNNTKISLLVSSVDGKLILKEEYSLLQGYNELRLDANRLPGKGCYLYQIISSDNINSGKIILH